jgi:hypothetical protein
MTPCKENVLCISGKSVHLEEIKDLKAASGGIGPQASNSNTWEMEAGVL